MALGKVRNCFEHIETCVVSDNYFRSITGLPPAPYPECQPSQTALEQNSPEYLMLLAQLEVNSVNRLLEQSGMYHDGKVASNTSTLPTPRVPITPVTTTTAFSCRENTEWCQPINHVNTTTTFSGTSCIYICTKWKWTRSLLYYRLCTFDTHFSTRYV